MIAHRDLNGAGVIAGRPGGRSGDAAEEDTNWIV
jgi:hypothetical protein